MDSLAINSSLYREILDGRNFDRHFERNSCPVKNAGRGRTDFGLKAMAKAARIYQQQASNIAPVLDQGNLADTIEEIHWFLYNHIQYSIDPARQQLRSPACSWAERRKGIDCKSYSIFASTILLNLGIKHYLRRVRQPDLHEDAFTHVYVLVPLDQKSGSLTRYYIIDGTVEENNEVPYLEKDDIFMEPTLSYVYMGSPAPGCTCTGQHGHGAIDLVGGRTLAAPTAQIQKALMDFENFLEMLRQFAPSPLALQQLRNIVLDKLETGRDPLIRITKRGISVDDTFVNLSTTFKNLRSQVGPAMGATGDILGIVPGLDILGNVLDLGFADNTLGAVLANGFNFSCWGASWNPESAKASAKWAIGEMQKDLNTFINSRPQQLIRAFNDFLVEKAYKIHSAQRHWLMTTAKDCTKDGLTILVETENKAIQAFTQAVRNRLQSQGYAMRIATPTRKFYPDPWEKGHDLTMDVEQYSITRTTGGTDLDFGGGDNDILADGLSDTFVDGDGNIQTTGNGPRPQQAGMGGGLVVLLIAGAAVATIAYGRSVFGKTK
ncbi:transglutaminase-like domain-containing protein [Sungkyunkwania multivorans]|uniref:Transglutaminase-like domain-containing protein n=1 Tax=Sungkyunkwania multivorans TaxID=1173618 RepID=A0ABW3D0L4_9FLAO